MNYQQTLRIVAFIATISMCTAHIGGGQISLQNIDPQVYCGRTLARTLALLCFDGTGVDKRSETGTLYNAILAPYYKEQDVGWPWMAPQKARALSLPSRGKRYPGVVNECCDKPCSINELLQYC